METIKAAVLGASGYTGGELLRLIGDHPNVRATHLTAERHAGKNIGEVFPHLRGFNDSKLQILSADSIPDDIDVVFAALPHGTSAAIIKKLYDRDIKIIDLGADFRLSHEKYEEWYIKHPCPELLPKAVYGLPELHRERIRKSKLVANPGCYPTSAILALAPLLKNEIIAPDPIIVDSKSGVTGAGRSPSLDFHFCEVNEGIKAYKIDEHRHMPEIEEILSRFTGQNVEVSFTPHLIPMDRGILSTIYVRLNRDISTAQVIDQYKQFYNGEPFIRILPENSFPSTAHVRGSNFCDIGIKVNEKKNTAIIISAIDNLVKGASGAAIQNMNVMFGFEETLGISHAPMFP